MKQSPPTNDVSVSVTLAHAGLPSLCNREALQQPADGWVFPLRAEHNAGFLPISEMVSSLTCSTNEINSFIRTMQKIICLC